MQNYEQILQELGIEVPEDKKSNLKKKMDENYRTKSDYDKVVQKRDEYKTSLDDVQTKLDGFKDVDVNDLKTQITTLTTQLNDEKAARAADARKVELEKTVNEFFASTDDKGEKLYEFLNDITENHYREELTKALDSDSAKGKSIADIFKGMIVDKDGKTKAGIFVDKQQTQAQQNAARFTTSIQKGSGTGGTMTKEDFKKMNLDERLKLKQSDPDLFAALSK
ncbi:phage scaffolding protein [Blautia sp. MSJ-19]|uniref:phage scaffolding protein n=1 Tax=Blautia sp. MSJ-19 TaxID=2841517 RepID=UPI001C0EBA51|nr:phage scaffolding protein [Blautia sp. MSJ-19]MBU5481727.1 phage scaffolding protein [Blautia sp. MSJ-19]